MKIILASRKLWPGVAAVILASSMASKAQSPAQSAADKNEIAIALPEFEVRDTRTGAYGAKEVVSTTRISLSIQDIAQTASVVTRELLDDTQGLRMLDVAKFVTPLSQGSTGGGDRYTIRGFETAVRFVDGVNLTGMLAFNTTSDLTNVERLEIVKGPNAILVPGGGFGGIMNQITKSPKFEDFARLSVRARSYLGSEVSLDTSRVAKDAKNAGRVVATWWDGDGYFDGQYRRGWLLAPSWAHRFSDGADLIVKLELLRNTESSSMGVVLDPAVGTHVGGYARKHPLLPRDNQWGPDGDNRFRFEARLNSELRFKLGRNIAARVWLMGDQIEFFSHGAGAGAPVAGAQGGPNPLTGEWEPFKTFAYNATTRVLTVTNRVPSSDARFNRSGQSLRLRFNEAHLKNDYAAEYALGLVARATTVAGLSANLSHLDFQNWGTTRPAVSYVTGERIGPDDPLILTLRGDKKSEQRDLQLFLYQRVNLLENRVIFSGGLSKFWGILERLDNGNVPAQTPLRATRNAVADGTAGVSYKPVPAVSIFAGYNRVGGALPASTLAGEITSDSFKIGVGEQWEYGVKTSFLKGRATVSAAYYEISQSNVQVANAAAIQDPTQPRYFFFDLKNHGWEIEANALLTHELELVGNFSHLHMRDTYGIPQRTVPDKLGALFAKYTFRHNRLRGLGLSAGVDYVDKTPGETVTLFTAAGVSNQPSFYVAPRTLLQAGISYRRERWSVGLMVHNLTNKDYIQTASSRTNLLPGEPRNGSLTIELKF